MDVASRASEMASPDHRGDDLFTVVSESGFEYTVDVREGRCDCPDQTHNLDDDEACKHEIRALVATGRVSIPAWADQDTMDDMLGAHVDGGPWVVATDGGVAVGTETDDCPDVCPDDCECSGADDVCACWPCYAAGFAFSDPNPDAPGDDEASGWDDVEVA